MQIIRAEISTPERENDDAVLGAVRISTTPLPSNFCVSVTLEFHHYCVRVSHNYLFLCYCRRITFEQIDKNVEIYT